MERNIFKSLILAAALMLAVPAAINAQDYISAPVTVSKDKVRVNGKVCWSHIVREKQTLFSIAKAYDVSVDDIYAFNPTLKESGLKKNSIILIPSKEALESKKAETAVLTESAVQTAPAVQEEPEKKPEPEVRQEPESKPVDERKTDPEQKPVAVKKAKKQTIHTVKWFEDLDVIAEKYGVTVEEIMKANDLSGRKLAKRQKLVIPEPGQFAAEEQKEEIEMPEEETVETEPADTTGFPVPETEPDPEFTPKEEVTVTLILPLKASTDNVSRNNMDFYSGVLLALRDLAETGVSTDINVYDSSDSSNPISSEDITDSDMVIGPVSSGDLVRLLDSEQEPKTLISPLDQRAESLAYTNRNFIQVPTPLKVQYQDLIYWMKEDTAPGDTLLIISEKGAKNTEAITLMTQAADSSGLDFIPFSYSILEGRDITVPLTKLMTATGTNRVLIASDSEAFVNDVVRNLNILVYNKLNVALYAPARIRNFETIEVENLHNTNLHVSLGYLIDYESQQVKDFLLKYRALYNTEPTQYAFQGYDVATYFISLCSRYGDLWTRKLEESERQMLQGTFRMVPVAEGGYVNHGIRRVVYGPEWSVTQVR